MQRTKTQISPNKLNDLKKKMKMSGKVSLMFKTQRTTCCGHSTKKSERAKSKVKPVTTEEDVYTFEDLPCDVRHLLHELRNRKANVDIELLLIKINNHIRQTESFRKKDCDPRRFETDLKLFKEWFNQRDEQKKEKFQFYYGKDDHQRVANYMNFSDKYHCENDASKAFWNKITEMITGPEHEAKYLRKIIQKIQEYRQQMLNKRRKIKDSPTKKVNQQNSVPG